jgi:ribosomal protein S12 methylthiotransferase accessory factor
MTFNDNSHDRKMYYMALNTVLDITLNKQLKLKDYIPSMTKMFGEKTLNNAVESVTGKIRFFGLTKTNMQLEGLDKHLRLIESYQKLQTAKRNFHL